MAQVLAARRPLVIIPCGARKLDRPAPAAELYVGSYFRACLRFTRELAPDDDIRILSAKHGLVRLDDVLCPYEQKLRRSHLPQLRRQLYIQIRHDCGDLTPRSSVLALCGGLYAEVLNMVCRPVAFPLAGVGGIGKQLAWLKNTDPAEVRRKYLEGGFMAEKERPIIFGEPLSEEWLARVGFKWHQLERQTAKHWLLWLGSCLGDMTSMEDLGIEVAPGVRDGKWFCWLRRDTAGRYHRFVHVRHIRTRSELVAMIEGLTGQRWNPDNNLYGSMRTPAQAARLREDDERLDRQLLFGNPRWYGVEGDDTRGGALPEHLQHHADHPPEE